MAVVGVVAASLFPVATICRQTREATTARVTTEAYRRHVANGQHLLKHWGSSVQCSSLSTHWIMHLCLSPGLPKWQCAKVVRHRQKKHCLSVCLIISPIPAKHTEWALLALQTPGVGEKKKGRGKLTEDQCFHLKVRLIQALAQPVPPTNCPLWVHALSPEVVTDNRDADHVYWRYLNTRFILPQSADIKVHSWEKTPCA